MIGHPKLRPFLIATLLMIAVMARAETQRAKEGFFVQGCLGNAPVVHLQGRSFVDVQDLARITNGSLSFERDRIILTPPRCDASKTTVDDSRKSGFSHAFMKPAIEAVASIREWGGTLIITVQNGYAVKNTIAGDAITAYQGRASDNIAVASSAASTESDYRGLELLRNEFNNVQAWSEEFVKARNSQNAANLAVSESWPQDDPDVGKMTRCGQFLAQMFPSGKFQDDAACH
jgi:hypothetical protein